MSFELLLSIQNLEFIIHNYSSLSSPQRPLRFNNTFTLLSLILQNSSLAADGPTHFLIYEERVKVLLRLALLLNPRAATIA